MTWPPTLSSAGVLSGTPVASELDTVTVRVTDSLGDTAVGTFALTVNSVTAPQWLTLPTISFPQGTPNSFNLASFCTDPQSLPLTYTLASGSLPTGVTLASNGVLSYNGVGAVTSTSASFTATDTLPLSATSSVTTISVSGGLANFYVYQNYAFPANSNGCNTLWGNYDLSFGSGTIIGNDTSHPQPGHSFDLALTNKNWQPAAALPPVNTPSCPVGFDLSPYTWWTFSIYIPDTTVNIDDIWHYNGNYYNADQTCSTYIQDLRNYAPYANGPIVNNTWVRFTIPLIHVGHVGIFGAYKFYIRYSTGTLTLLMDDVGFIPGGYSFVYDGGAPYGFDISTVINATATVAGTRYVIKTLGSTDFTQIGAPKNTVGQYFVATGVGSGTGTVTTNSYLNHASTLLNGWTDASVNCTANYAVDPATLSYFTNGNANSLNGIQTPGYSTDKVATFTGSCSGTTLTVTAMNAGTIVKDAHVVGAGIFDPGTKITGQLTGVPGGVGTYSLGATTTAPSESMSSIGQNNYSTKCVGLSITANGGMWKVTHSGFTVAPYAYLGFGLIPTKASHNYVVQLYSTGGVPVGNAVNPSAYTPHDWGNSGGFGGNWTTYAIPVSAFGSLPAQIGGMSIQDTSNQGANTIYLSAPVWFY